jgi:hypothetical protein
MHVSGVGFQAKRSATGGSPPPVSGVRRSDRWTALRGAPPCDLDLAGNTAILQPEGYGWNIKAEVEALTRPAGLQRSRCPLGNCSSCDAGTDATPGHVILAPTLSLCQ